MINLRYHIVSITAVFLALGIGITMGSTFLGRATFDQIDRNVTNARAEIRQVRKENSELRKQAELDSSRASDFLDEGVGTLFTNSLTDVPVLVIASDGVDQESLDNLRLALTSSGALFDGTLVATDKLELSGDDADLLAEDLDSKSTSTDVLRAQLGRQVSAELLAAAEPIPGSRPTGSTTTTTKPAATTTTAAPAPTLPGTPSTLPPSTTTTTTAPPRNESPELIRALIDDGFFDYQPALGGATVEQMLTRVGYRYVIVTGSTASLADADFVVPLLRAMTAQASAPVVVASAAVGDAPEVVRTASIGPLIDDEVIGDRITTVDDLETLSGVSAIILSLEDLGRGRHGHYGVGEGAKSQLPAPRN